MTRRHFPEVPLFEIFSFRFFLVCFVRINSEGDDVEGSWRVVSFWETTFWRGNLLHPIFTCFLVINGLVFKFGFQSGFEPVAVLLYFWCD